METSGIEEELESLLAIYDTELQLNENCNGLKEVSITLLPATGQNAEQQYVCFTLNLQIPHHYPSDLPKILIKGPRGFSEEQVIMIVKDLTEKANELKGHPMLFELIEHAKEHLTASNMPSCECSICLYNFMESDVFMKTDCYHYFHCYCLALYVEKYQENANITAGQIIKILCPVCRTEIDYKLTSSKDDFPQPVEQIMDDTNAFSSTSLRQQQIQLAQIYEKQKANGGIIDVEAEKNKYLLNISHTTAQSTSNSIETSANQAVDTSTAKAEKEPINMPNTKASSNDKRTGANAEQNKHDHKPSHKHENSRQSKGTRKKYDNYSNRSSNRQFGSMCNAQSQKPSYNKNCSKNNYHHRETWQKRQQHEFSSKERSGNRRPNFSRSDQQMSEGNHQKQSDGSRRPNFSRCDQQMSEDNHQKRPDGSRRPNFSRCDQQMSEGNHQKEPGGCRRVDNNKTNQQAELSNVTERLDKLTTASSIPPGFQQKRAIRPPPGFSSR